MSEELGSIILESAIGAAIKVGLEQVVKGPEAVSKSSKSPSAEKEPPAASRVAPPRRVGLSVMEIHQLIDQQYAKAFQEYPCVSRKEYSPDEFIQLVMPAIIGALKAAVAHVVIENNMRIAADLAKTQLRS